MQKLIAIILVIVSIYFEVSDAKCGCQYEYKKVGCFKDRRGSEALPEMLANERDIHSAKYNGHDINWFDWNNYMPALVCRCAEQALKKGYKYFGIQFWGECWSGPGDEIEYDKYGEGGACYGRNYQMCHENDVNCVGANSHNFVYEIATYECDVHFEKIGCYNDYSRNNLLALTARDDRSHAYMGETIDWWNYDIFLPKFACECAKKVVAAGYNTFGMQYYGECWTGQKFADKYYIAQGKSHNCINKCYQRCRPFDRFCIGEGFANTIYRITHPDCEMKYESLGCFKAVDKDNNMAMPELLLDEISPASEKFKGYILEFDERWEKMYKDLLCRCARAAEDKGYSNFAIRNNGECWSGPNSDVSYNQFGESDQCVRKWNNPCTNNIMCAGKEDGMSVYKLLGRKIQIGK